MPRPKKSVPAYAYHISGQARVYLDGKHYYLGEYDSPASRAKYLALLATYEENGRKMPVDVPADQLDTPVTVALVTREFREEVKHRYAGNKEQQRIFNSHCGLLEFEYGDIPANEFGPRKLAELRDLFIAEGHTRAFINRQVREIVRIFRFAVSRELIGPERIVALQSLEPLKAGQTKAKESEERQPVDMEHVRKTAAHLSPVLKAMVMIQAATGMRPSEVFNMRPCDIDRTGEVWMYRPPNHKTSSKGKKRAVPILGAARDTLVPFLLRPADQPCFSPAESYKWYQRQRSASRKTREGQGNEVGTCKKENPKWAPGSKFRRDSYRNAILRAAKKAKVPHWYPYQLRHTAATILRAALGIEAAQALLGHSTVSMTERYAKQSEAKAIEAAQALA